jgi:hypothetical protein
VNVGGGGIFWLLHASSTSRAAAARLETNLARIQAIVAQTDLTQPAKLTQLQKELAGATDALDQLQSALPFGGVIGTGDERAEAHAIQLGLHLSDAMQGAITAFLAVRPGLIALTNSVFQGAQAAIPAGGKRLTLDDVHAAQVALFGALISWKQALSLRSSLTQHDLATISAPTFLALMRRFDQISPTLDYALSTMSALVDWSPASFGLQTPEHFLLVDMDTSVLRPTGGAIARYAVLTTDGGALTSGVRLQPTAALDCPRASCPAMSLPPVAQWSALNPLTTRLQNANVNPDLADSAYQIESIFDRKVTYQVDGLILVTPALFADVLAATGPITLPQPHAEVTAANVQDWLSAYHRTAGAAGGGTPADWAATDPDALLTQAIMARLATLNATQRDAVGQAVLRAFATKDLQLFANSPRVEAMLEVGGRAGQVLAPSGDSLEVVDTNLTGASINPLITETASDTVALDAQGGASHTLTLTYRYSLPEGDVAPGANYVDLVRVVVPEGTQPGGVSGPCAPVTAPLSHHVVLACQLNLAPGTSASVRFSWHAPQVGISQGTTSAIKGAYTLLIQRQPGARLDIALQVAAPTDQTFQRAVTPSQVADGRLTFAATPLETNVVVQARLSP